MSLKPTIKGNQAAGGLPAWLPGVMWGVALAAVALVLVLFARRSAAAAPTTVDTIPLVVPTVAPLPADVNLPQWSPDALTSLSRNAIPRTAHPQRSSVSGHSYTVTEGDSVFGIAEQFKLQPESVLWANFTVLKDNPDLLSIGQLLQIPPTNGVYYKVKEGDTLETIAGQFKAKALEIMLWPGNNLDLASPTLTAGSMVMVPNGKRDFVRTWVLPAIPRGAAGVTMNLPGSCNTGAGGAYGTGSFIWPGNIRTISGNNYWSGHLAIDIAAVVGMPVFASDSGVVVYAGGDSSGYGNVILIDHGNGFQTLYAHLNSIFVRCGQSVLKGSTIAGAGTTGNSTGPHIHFEIRYLGGFVNPLNYLR